MPIECRHFVPIVNKDLAFESNPANSMIFVAIAANSSSWGLNCEVPHATDARDMHPVLLHAEEFATVRQIPSYSKCTVAASDRLCGVVCHEMDDRLTNWLSQPGCSTYPSQGIAPGAKSLPAGSSWIHKLTVNKAYNAYK